MVLFSIHLDSQVIFYLQLCDNTNGNRKTVHFFSSSFLSVDEQVTKIYAEKLHHLF